MNRPQVFDHAALHTRLRPLLDHGWTIMLFDGDCRLCDGATRFIATRSPRGRVAFCVMQTDCGKRSLEDLGLTRGGFDSVLVLENRNALERSDALIRIAERMDHPWPLIGRAVGLVPRFIRDRLYDVIARSRYRIFGRTRLCVPPSDEVARRFIA